MAEKDVQADIDTVLTFIDGRVGSVTVNVINDDGEYNIVYTLEDNDPGLANSRISDDRFYRETVFFRGKDGKRRKRSIRNVASDDGPMSPVGLVSLLGENVKNSRAILKRDFPKETITEYFAIGGQNPYFN